MLFVSCLSNNFAATVEMVCREGILGPQPRFCYSSQPQPQLIFTAPAPIAYLMVPVPTTTFDIASLIA